MIYKLKADGIIKPGVHFYSVGIGVCRGKCVYSVSACRKSLLERTKEVRNRKLIKVKRNLCLSNRGNKKKIKCLKLYKDLLKEEINNSYHTVKIN